MKAKPRVVWGYQKTKNFVWMKFDETRIFNIKNLVDGNAQKGGNFARK